MPSGELLSSMLHSSRPRKENAVFALAYASYCTVDSTELDLDALARAIDDALGQPKLITFAQDIPEPVEIIQ